MCIYCKENSLVRATKTKLYFRKSYSYDDPYELFLYALKSSETKRQYPKRLKVVFDYLVSIDELKEIKLENQCKEIVSKTLQNPHWLTCCLMRFIIFQNERIQRKEIVAITAYNYIRSLKLFIDMNFDMPPINWKKITRGLPSRREIANDRAPTIEEIQKIIEYPDRRIKPLILCMVSGGFRLGAWDYLKWKHVIPMRNKEGEIIAAKLVIYAGEPEEYYCFITPEAFRKICVNAISPGSIDTPILNPVLNEEQVKQFKKNVTKSIPMGRMGSPDEVAKAVLFLASDDSSYVTGIELFVDGGIAQI
jgi:hypothetical protein